MRGRQLRFYLAVLLLFLGSGLLLTFTGNFPIEQAIGWIFLYSHPGPPLAWRVHPTSWHPQEIRHIVFVKVHKAASSTIYNVLVRFAQSRHLYVMFPRDSNLLSQKDTALQPLVDYPPSSPHLFDILCNHVVFDRDVIRPYLPDDVTFVAILREPLRQMLSAFYYFRNQFSVSYLLQSPNSFQEFLQNIEYYEPGRPRHSLTNNRMSIDLGLDPYQLSDHGSSPETFVSSIEKLFHLVLIAERFDESMVLLKRRLRWTTKDILYRRLNSRDVSNRGENGDNITAQLKEKFRRYSRFDIALYDHFYKLFDQQVLKEGPDFVAEVKTFQAIEEMVMHFCENSTPGTNATVIPASPWNEVFEFYAEECETISMEEIEMDQRAKYWQQRRAASR